MSLHILKQKFSSITHHWHITTYPRAGAFQYHASLHILKHNPSNITHHYTYIDRSFSTSNITFLSSPQHSPLISFLLVGLSLGLPFGPLLVDLLPVSLLLASLFLVSLLLVSLLLVGLLLLELLLVSSFFIGLPD